MADASVRVHIDTERLAEIVKAHIADRIEPALRDAIEVLGYVSRGRRYVDVEPYPDALARRALGALGDAGLLREATPKDQVLTEEERGTGRVWVFSLDAKPDVLFADGTHRYWSTHCRHGDHDACSSTVLCDSAGNAINRVPASCKQCGAPCRCSAPECPHREVSDG